MGSSENDKDSLERKLAELECSVESYRLVERELRQANDFSESLIETAHAIVLTLDLKANITQFNLAAEKLTGYSKSEVIGKNWFDIFIPDSIREQVRRVFTDVVKRSGEISSHENAIITKNGVEKIISWSNNIMRGDDNAPVGVLSIGVDITERVRAENSLVAAKERLQKESEALTQKNIAMSQILNHIEKEREKFREELAGNVENLLAPIVEKLRCSEGCLSAKDIDHLEDALKSILGKEIDVFQQNLTRLSGRELQVAEMIRKGLSSKEIADMLGIAIETVGKHRESIRRKFQITRSTVNLSTFLKSRPWPT